MKYFNVVLAAVLFTFFHPNQAKADEAQLPEVIISGDSWAALPCFFGSIDNAFFNRHLDVDVHGCLLTTQIGVRAENFKTVKAYQKTLEHLRKNKNAKVVYLSLGGNDMFSYWNKSMSPATETALFTQIRDNVRDIVNEFHKVRPDVWVLVSGYDFGYLYANNPFSGYRKIYEQMGSPNPEETNNGFYRFATFMLSLKGDRTVYQHHNGLMHYYYGAPEAGVSAHKTLAPNLISTPDAPERAGGVFAARNNKMAMAHIFSYFFDPHHLRPAGFMKLFEHVIDLYIGPWLKGSSYSAFENGDDMVSGEVSEEIESQGVDMAQKDFAGE